MVPRGNFKDRLHQQNQNVYFWCLVRSASSAIMKDDSQYVIRKEIQSTAFRYVTVLLWSLLESGSNLLFVAHFRAGWLAGWVPVAMI
jgi:hypothetical protein